MLTGFSDSSLDSFLFWLQMVGLVGLLCLTVSLAGGIYLTGEIRTRAYHKVSQSQLVEDAARSEAAKAKTLAREEEQKLEIVQKQEAPRQLTDAQKSSFIAAMKDVPKGPVMVYIYEYRSKEVADYASQIRDMLIAAGFSCGNKVEISTKPFSPEGLLVVAKDPVSAPAYAGAIQHALGVIGIDAPAARDSNLDMDNVVVVVGRKPE